MTERKPMIAVLTGAGISTGSGIPDFRGPDGVWTRDPAKEKLFTLQNYLADPEVRWSSWLSRKDNPAWTAEPNPAHKALVELEQAGFPMRIITQNIDGLHQKAGSTERKVIELHGNMFSVKCMDCRQRTTMREALDRVEQGERDPSCLDCGGILKSGTIMFGEALDANTLNTAAQISLSCQVFWAIGTSLTVEPAASLCAVAAGNGAEVTIVNAQATPYDDVATSLVREEIGVALPRMVRELISRFPAR